MINYACARKRKIDPIILILLKPPIPSKGKSFFFTSGLCINSCVYYFCFNGFFLIFGCKNLNQIPQIEKFGQQKINNQVSRIHQDSNR
jgi:hypothetical protein